MELHLCSTYGRIDAHIGFYGGLDKWNSINRNLLNL